MTKKKQKQKNYHSSFKVGSISKSLNLIIRKPTWGYGFQYDRVWVIHNGKENIICRLLNIYYIEFIYAFILGRTRIVWLN